MKRILFLITVFVASNLFASSWHIRHLSYETNNFIVGREYIRVGYIKANTNVPFKGNVLYLQGLGDSMMNHDRLLSQISDLGYRVIAFDYMGQGGSTGSMNNTRIYNPLSPGLTVSQLAKFVYRSLKKEDGRKPVVVGWSTGGLAAYGLASEEWARKVILIAPGLYVKKIVGEYGTITERTLTSDIGTDQHVDPIKPTSPFKAPLFAVNLLKSSILLRQRSISPAVSGLVFITDKNDKYVQSAKKLTNKLKKKAPHFQRVLMPEAKHEVDNEIAPIRDRFLWHITKFLE